MSEQETLADEVQAFLDETGMSRTAFGLAAVQDRNFVTQLMGGRECRKATREKVRDAIAAMRATRAEQAA